MYTILKTCILSTYIFGKYHFSSFVLSNLYITLLSLIIRLFFKKFFQFFFKSIFLWLYIITSLSTSLYSLQTLPSTPLCFQIHDLFFHFCCIQTYIPKYMNTTWSVCIILLVWICFQVLLFTIGYPTNCSLLGKIIFLSLSILP